MTMMVMVMVISIQVAWLHSARRDGGLKVDSATLADTADSEMPASEGFEKKKTLDSPLSQSVNSCAGLTTSQVRGKTRSGGWRSEVSFPSGKVQESDERWLVFINAQNLSCTLKVNKVGQVASSTWERSILGNHLLPVEDSVLISLKIHYLPSTVWICCTLAQRTVSTALALRSRWPSEQKQLTSSGFRCIPQDQ